MPAELRSTSHGQTLVLTIRNPDLHNALDPAIYAAGTEALNGAERNAEVRSVVITGADGVFSAGGNLQRLQANRSLGAAVQEASIEALHNWIETIRAYPKSVVAWSLARALPRPLATELLMCGERTSAERLHALGLVNRLAEPGGALAAALELAQTLNERAPNALASIKELLDEAGQHTLNAHLHLERQHFVRNLHHANAGEGISAFLEKRKPHYR